jgi:Putative peptidoglycan binding domain
MPTARARAIALACCAGAAAAILLAGPLARPASSQQTEAAVSNPMAGDGMWIWYLSRAQGGNVNRIAKKAHRRGIEYVLVKSGDAGSTWSQFSPSLVSALHARGLRVCGWQFVYGRNVKREAAVGAAAVARGADCLVIDAEGHYEGRYPQASTYIRKLRALVGPDYPLALAAFPYADYHPAFPFSVFLGPGGAQYNAPQLYWKTIGDSVDEAFVHTWVFNRPYGRPILPLGQVYLNPSGKQISRFRRLAAAYGMEGVSWWSWQHAGRRQWKAVGKGVAPLSSEVVYDSYPTLRPGSKGDLVAWAQQLLAGGGFSTPVTGYYESPTRSAVSALQSQRGLPATGSIDSATWRLMLEFEPLAVRWTKQGAVKATKSGLSLPAPRSASLPAKRYEIPPSGHRP